MPTDPPYCLFRCNAKPYGVAVEAVAEVVEVPTLVRISHCSTRIAGLCAFHREVVPVVSLSNEAHRVDRSAVEWRARGRLVTESLLILQTEQGLWGIRVDADGTLISAGRPSRYEPAQTEGRP